MQTSYDFVIVGSGSAGCPIAHRLSENPDLNVLLVEAGPADRSIRLKVPAAFIYEYTSARHNWLYRTEPEPQMNNRRIFCPRGKVLGGSSSINGMAFVRGQPQDFDGWAARNLPSWSYAHCLPYFKRMETYSGGGDDYRGSDGPLRVRRPPHENPLYEYFLEAVQTVGYGLNDDTNAGRQEGFGPMDQTIHLGRRCSASVAYLQSIDRRANLDIEVGCRVTRILFDGGRATAIEMLRAGQVKRVQAREEIVLAAGAINSPQLLMLSGIGPAGQLAGHGIDTVVDLPGVGANLQDHWDFQLQQECTRPLSVNPEFTLLNRARAGLRWLLTGDGPAATNQSEIAGYFRSSSSDRPDLQISFMPLAIDYEKMQPTAAHGFLLFGMPLRPTSAGCVRLKSADPLAAPAILCNYLATEKDRRDTLDLLEACRNIVAQPAFDPIRGAEIEPGPGVRGEDDMLRFVSDRGKPTHHLCGSCRMGTDDMAVVDEKLRVYGVENLRVADASIMPSITSGNTNAPVIMIGEKAADLLAGRSPLPPVRLSRESSNG